MKAHFWMVAMSSILLHACTLGLSHQFRVEGGHWVLFTGLNGVLGFILQTSFSSWSSFFPKFHILLWPLYQSFSDILHNVQQSNRLSVSFSKGWFPPDAVWLLLEAVLAQSYRMDQTKCLVHYVPRFTPLHCGGVQAQCTDKSTACSTFY